MSGHHHLRGSSRLPLVTSFSREDPGSRRSHEEKEYLSLCSSSMRRSLLKFRDQLSSSTLCNDEGMARSLAHQELEIPQDS